MQCMKSIEPPPLEGAQEYSAKDNRCFPSGFRICQETTLLTFFAHDAMDCSFQKAHDKPTLTAPTLVQPFLICTS